MGRKKKKDSQDTLNSQTETQEQATQPEPELTEEKMDKVLEAAEAILKRHEILENVQKQVFDQENRINGVVSRIQSLESAVVAIMAKQATPGNRDTSSNTAVPRTVSTDRDDVLAGLAVDLSSKLEVYTQNNELRVRPTQWLGKDNWRVVNKYLNQDGFSWFSNGQDSYWTRKL